jgi:hypothetical protein
LGRWLFILWSFLWANLGKEVSILWTLVSPMVCNSPFQHIHKVCRSIMC